jgi:hypothetical protein
VVDHVGVRVVAPLLGLNFTLPGAEPTLASAGPADSAAVPAVTPISPNTTTARRIELAARHLIVRPWSALEAI